MRGIGAAAVLLAGLLWSGAALADCTDPPQPKVDWRRCNMHAREFVNANLSDAKLKDGRFTQVDFSGSNLSGIDGRRAKFIAAVARKSNFDDARLIGADFTEANLSQATLKNANLYGAQLQSAVLRGADLTGANLDNASMAYADLSGARWTDGKTICAEGSIGQCIPKSSSGASG